MATETRERMIEVAMSLFQRHGYRATSWRVLTQEGATPWGSVQHHFPGGKEELGVAAVKLAEQSVNALIVECFAQAEQPSDGIRRWFSASADLLSASSFDGGCPVAPVVLEMSAESAVLRAACSEAFLAWTETVARALRDQLGEIRAEQLASTVVACFEGALILARSHAETAPLVRAADTVATMIDAEIARRLHP
ncbi:TetR/AcrR family transcriptional regulator [Actinospongicola halichondriae]|uniref:TetR/AcrR family transcriptional regulator n=1 Tax=Actinospongicola halichondriae TaxID=3236844 RepID=UPI003D3D980D